MASSPLSFLLSLPLIASLHLGTVHPVSDEVAEQRFHPNYLSQATGIMDEQPALHPWPVPLISIGNTIACYQNYGGGDSASYFHMGLDMRVEAGSPVRAAAGGQVINIQNYEPGEAAYWEVAIKDDQGFIWQYHHIDSTTIPQEIYEARQSGNPIAAGTKLGEVFYWPIVSEGERYNHIHVNILGSGGVYLNPFAFLEPLEDKVAPEIAEISLLKNGNRVSGTVVSGSYSLLANAGDLILSSKFVVPPNEYVIEIDGGTPQTVWKFDSLPGGTSNSTFVNDLFIPGLVCGDYECRKPIVDLGFSKNAHQVFPTAQGNHHVKLTVKDFVGNATSREFSWQVE